jgi:hypothetical protein
MIKLEFAPEAGWELDDQVVEVLGWDPYPPGYAPPYSRDLTLAWTLWMKLRESGAGCCLELDSDSDYIWTAQVTRSELRKEGYVMDAGHEPAVGVQGDAGIEPVICAAFLAGSACGITRRSRRCDWGET